MSGDFLGAAVAGAFDLIGDRWNNAFNASQRKQAFQGQLQLMLMQQAWQEKMRATAYQTTMEDMRKAGLNPMLAMHNGASGVPGGSAPSSPTAHAASPSGLGQAIMRGFGASAQNELMRVQAQQAAAATARELAQGEQALTQADLNRADSDLRRVQTNSELERPDLNRAYTEQARAAAGHSAAEASRARATEEEIRQRIGIISRSGPPGGLTSPQVLQEAGRRLIDATNARSFRERFRDIFYNRRPTPQSRSE